MAADLDAMRRRLAAPTPYVLPEEVQALIAEVEELRAQLTASRRLVRAAVACLTSGGIATSTPGTSTPPRPPPVTGATIHALGDEVGRR